MRSRSFLLTDVALGAGGLSVWQPPQRWAKSTAPGLYGGVTLELIPSVPQAARAEANRDEEATSRTMRRRRAMSGRQYYGMPRALPAVTLVALALIAAGCTRTDIKQVPTRTCSCR